MGKLRHARRFGHLPNDIKPEEKLGFDQGSLRGTSTE